MTLHLPTLLLTLVLGFMLLTVHLAVARRALHARPELQLWTSGCWAVLLGFVSLGARAVLPASVLVSMLLGSGLICFGLALFAQAVHQFVRGGPRLRWVMRLQWLIWPLLALMLTWPGHRRATLMSLIFSLLLLPSALTILRHGWSGERSLRVVGLTLLMAILALLLRALHAWTTPADYAEMLQASLGQGLSFLVAFIGLLGAGFGFVMAVFERVALQLEQQATHDGLTGCLNRTTTDTLLEHALQRGRREAAPLAFVLLDLDHFKQVNDLHGHRTGDRVLRTFADTVRQRLRGSDVLGRTGGEEFGLLLPNTDAAGARRLVEAVRDAVQALEFSAEQGGPFRITVSAGIAVAAADSDVSGDRLYGQADQALYEAKHGGRNRVELYGASNPAQRSLLPQG